MGSNVARLRRAAVIRPAPREDKPWWSPRDAAAYLGVSMDTIYEACARKGLRHSKIGHSCIRLRREWIDEWAEGRAVIKP